MARKKDPEIVHPLAAIEALSGYHSDIGYALAVVNSAVSLLKNTDLDANRVRETILPSLEDAVKRISRWYYPTN